MLAVLSPAKKLHGDGIISPLPPSQPALLDDTELLMQTARALQPTDLRRLMKISEALAELNYQRFQAFHTPFTPENARPAALLFAGDTYVGLDAASLSADDLAWGQGHLGILSGLYGLLRPLDLIQPYRLEMGTRLANPRGANLVRFWRQRVSAHLTKQVAEHPDSAVVVLASKEYSAAIDPGQLERIEVVFQELKPGGPKVIGFYAKRARGAMARWMVQRRVELRTDLRAFAEGGYGWVAEASTPARLVFQRRL